MIMMLSTTQHLARRALRRPLRLGTVSALAPGNEPQVRHAITIKKFYRQPADAGTSPKPSRLENATDVVGQSETPTATAPPSTMRLAKRIAMAGVCSRREAERLIADEAVTVNGQVIKDPAVTVDPTSDRVQVHGRPLTNRARRQRVWMAHKLPGELITTSDPMNRPTIFDRLRVMGLPQHMMPVGRLDFNTEGLLLLTNDGDYARELEHPKSQIPRVYRVLVRGSVTPSKLQELRYGPTIDGIKYRPIHASIQSTDKKDTWLQVRLTEGKNREIRKALAHVRVVVKRLIRVQYGPYRLADLPSGAVLEVRPKALTTDETKQ